MKKEESIFGTDPDRLMRLMKTGLEADESEAENGIVETAPETTPEGKPGTRIDRYKLLRELGEGGMGIVYLAEQQGSIRRRVALKVIKPGMDSKRVLARFDAERQALALLDHPNIAHVYDAGMTETGRPYFVMEHVKGLPVTEHCDHYKLTIEQRLRLFQQVCQAVQHAHQKGIIHRDIKPSNILVTIHEDQAIPKIIDFGVAKAVLQPLTDRTLYTEQGQLFGTPEYMSPEQADMATEDIDTRSDIYSLGVLLYELLTGVLPFDSETLHGGGIERIRKVICETDPKTPSTRLTRLGNEAQKVAENRRTEIATLAKHLRKELEWIPLKAMRKERSERYRSASELADDVENYLQGNPLIAGPVTTAYRINKYVLRNQALVAGVVAVSITLIVGLIVSTALYFRAEDLRVEAQKASREAEQAAIEAKQAAEKETAARADAESARIEAERAGTEAQTILNFLQNDLLKSANRIMGREAMVADILDTASKNLKNKFRDQPSIEISIRETLGQIYHNLGYYKDSAYHRELGYRLRLEHQKPTFASRNWLAVSYWATGNSKEAERLFTGLIQERISNGKQPPVWLKLNLAHQYERLHLYEKAKDIYKETLKAAWWDPNHEEKMGHRLVLMHSWLLAKIYKEQGRYDDSEALFVKTLKAQRERYGPTGDKDNRAMMRCMNELARFYVIQKRYEEAESLFMEGIELGGRELPGKDHPFTLRHISGLGLLRTKQHRFEEAEALFDQALKGRNLKLGEDHPFTLETINDFGLLRVEQKRYKEAEELLIKARDGRLMKLGPDHPYTLESIHELAVLYKEQAQYEKAESLLSEAVEGRRLKLGDSHPHTLESLNNMVELYEAWGKAEEANQWRAKLPVTIDY